MTLQLDSETVPMTFEAGRWSGHGALVWTEGGAVRLGAPSSVPVKRLHLRWRGSLGSVRLITGDAWERAYGDMDWRGIEPDRAMPWYCATWDGTRTHGYGVKTGPRSFCFWRVDADGISLWCDVRSGGAAVELNERILELCQVTCREGHAGESAWAAIHAFCRMMCENPRLPAQPVYGHNDWYWVYGKNSAQTVMTDVGNIVELSPTGANRPFAVIDDGWQRSGTVGLWDSGNDKFGDMAALAARIKQAGARPGIWYRPIEGLDPTVPEVRERIRTEIRRLVSWGYELIKHDYTTFDIMGRWGFQMGTSLTRDNRVFAEGRGRTTAEIIGELYATIREAAGESLIIGCNTVSHLSAGQFEICRVGDDTSGEEWARTRRMGVNTLAFRGVQHGAFYVADPDCVGVTTKIPWAMNRQWLDLLARSGTMLFVSLAPDALGAAQRRDLRAALALAAQPQPLGEPLDWMRTAGPNRWKLKGREVRYDWVGGEGVEAP